MGAFQVFLACYSMLRTDDLQVRVDGMEEWLPAGEGLIIQPGQTLQFDTGL